MNAKTLHAMNDFFGNYMNDEAVVHVDRLSKIEKEEILEEMQDWETYMFCKEAQERLKERPVEDLPPVRCSGESVTENYIRFPVYDERSRTKNLAFKEEEIFYSSNENYSYKYSIPDFSSFEIRSRENWDEDYEECNKEEEERKILDAKIQKAKGNEAYKGGDYKKACEHYSNCITYGVTCGVDCVDAYNNRAQANMKMGNFASAIPDLNEVLQADPKNVKALFRRATCRKQLKMYREAKKDSDELFSINCRSQSARMLREEIENITSTLKGRSFRLRENVRKPETFLVDESQLPAYAEANRDCLDYLMEIDKTGCMKSCVCNFCTEEDRLCSQNNNSLRIGNRPKWAPVTFKLLDELKIRHKFVANPGNDDMDSKVNSAVSTNSNEPAFETNEGRATNKSISSSRRVRKKLSENILEHVIKDLNITNHAALDNNTPDVKRTRINLKQIQPRSLQKVFGETLNESTLTDLINSLCMDFDHTNEWNLMSEYMKELTRLKFFNTYFKLVDKRTRNDVSNILESATQQNLVEADYLKKLYTC